MDIRAAKRGGTIAPEVVTDRKEIHLSPEITEEDDSKKPEEKLPDNFPSDDEATMGLILLQYWEFLKENGIDKDDILGLLDSLISSGGVAWRFKLFNRIDVEFHMRKAWVDDVIMERLDQIIASSPEGRVSNIRYTNTIAEYNLAASLRRFGDKTYSVENKDDLDKVLEAVRDMPYVIQNSLVNKLAVFDRAVALAVSDWAVKNFMKPQSDS